MNGISDGCKVGEFFVIVHSVNIVTENYKTALQLVVVCITNSY